MGTSTGVLKQINAEVLTLLLSAIGGARRDRTADPLHAMQVLSQLSYSPEKRSAILVKSRAVSTRLSRLFLYFCPGITQSDRSVENR